MSVVYDRHHCHTTNKRHGVSTTKNLNDWYVISAEKNNKGTKSTMDKYWHLCKGVLSTTQYAISAFITSYDVLVRRTLTFRSQFYLERVVNVIGFTLEYKDIKRMVVNMEREWHDVRQT